MADQAMLRVEEILGDAFVEAYGLDDMDEAGMPEPDPELEDDDQ